MLLKNLENLPPASILPSVLNPEGLSCERLKNFALKMIVYSYAGMYCRYTKISFPLYQVMLHVLIFQQ